MRIDRATLAVFRCLAPQLILLWSLEMAIEHFYLIYDTTSILGVLNSAKSAKDSQHF